MTTTKPTLVSLGMSCQTTHQLSAFAEANPQAVSFTKGPFDWLICPPNSLADWLDSGLTDFEPDEISNHRDHAYWSKFNLWFWHGFMDHQHETRTLNIAANMSREQEKLSYQRSVFKALNPANTIFVFSNSQNNLTADVFKPDEKDEFQLDFSTMKRVQKSLDRFFESPTLIHWVTRQDRYEVDKPHHRHIHLLPPESTDWKGCPEDWNSALRGIIGL